MSNINASNFQWNDKILELDKPIWLEDVKQKIIDGDAKYKELYINDSYAFLAPDNYNTDENDNIDISENTQLEQASKEFDKGIKELKNRFVWACQETDQLDLIDKTTGWRLRDFISEAEYQANQYNSNTNHRPFAMWRRVVIKGNEFLTDDMKCVTEHMSKYDKF